MSIAQTKGWKEGLTIGEVEGVIKAVWKAETKPGQYGEYTQQDGSLEIDGQEVKFRMYDMGVIPQSAKGQRIKIVAGLNKKKRLSGIDFKPYHSEKEDRDVDNLKIAPPATIQYLDAPTQEKRATGHPSDSTVHYDKPRATIRPDQLVKVALTAHQDVNALVRNAYKDYDEETIRSYVSTVYIECCKKGLVESCLAASTAPAEPEKTKEPEYVPEVQDEVPADNEIPEDDIPGGVTDQFDYSEFKIPDDKKVPEQFRGKLFAEMFRIPGGKDYLKKFLELYNKTGYKTDLSKALRQFCLDFQLAEATDDGLNVTIK